MTAIPMPRRNPDPKPFEGELPSDEELLKASFELITDLMYGDNSDPFGYEDSQIAGEAMRSKLKARLAQ